MLTVSVKVGKSFCTLKFVTGMLKEPYAELLQFRLESPFFLCKPVEPLHFLIL